MHDPFPPGSTIVGYARDSGGDTQDLSVQEQLHAIQHWATVHACILQQTFCDEARPGSSVVGRTQFLAMIDFLRTTDCAQVAGLILWDYSRFGRAIDDSQYYRSDLRRRGYIVHSINETIPDTSIGRLFEAAIDWKNQTYLEDLSKNVKRGLNHNIAQYGAIGGVPPRGFIRQRIDLGQRRDGSPHTVSRWLPDPSMLHLVRQAFQMRAAGQSYNIISKATGIYSTGNPASWAHFFANKIYIGELRFGDQVISDYCEPIIDLDTWQAVQRINAESLRSASPKQRRNPRTIVSLYILTGLLYCARCGSPMVGNQSTRIKRYTNYYYDCTNRQRGGCDARQIPQVPLERAVLDALTNQFLQPAFLNQMQDDVVEQIKANQATGTQEEQTEIKNRLAELRRKANNITLAIAEAGHSTTLLHALADNELQQKTLQVRLESLNIKYIPVNLNDLDRISAALRADLGSVNQRATIQACIERIIVERVEDRITGTLSFTLPPQLLESSRGYVLSRRWVSTP